ncbi:hypothetical protein [Daejeonella lutea]|uniref:Uncharacterized protein n=1 Tax=Daejeonella lutea TaxID=572036 RepID=A0A1T5EPC2_9SPHI|nr:hypothetical protein [Daejeonella lutea]SKB85821.1 hypothetical protein SAMN05661099_3101 [Daejeonella lutea]
MIETSTPTTNSLQNDMVQHTAIPEELGEEEQSFYDSIKKNLNLIVKTPGKDVIARILSYSKTV